MKHLLRHIIPLLTVLAALTGCQDDKFTLPEPVGEGMATITASVDFMPMPSALSRSDGKALGSISYLYILLYDATTYELKYQIPIVTPDYKVSGYAEESQDRDDSHAEGGECAESTTLQAKFTLWDKIAYGNYYMYAVANIKDLIYDKRYEENIKTPEGLKKIILGWDETDVTQNGEMMGHFTATATSTPSEATALGEQIQINRQAVDLHCWLRRAASKVTVAFNGSGLNDGVKIYVLASSIKDIPRTCLLGNTNTPTSADDLIADGETIQYYTGSFYSNNTDNTDNTLADFKDKCPSVVHNNKDTSLPTSFTGSDHSETAVALYFYENMQGKWEDKDKRQKDLDGDGIVDNQDRQKDAMPYGTYIEVDAIYTATTDEGTETGVIKYRFMLGKNVIDDYDAERNYHYKLTLHFNGTAKDPDWHIDYQKQVFKVTEPKVMDYRGMVFVPEYRPWTKNYNLGHTFDYNTVTVASYIEEDNKLVPFKMEYSTDDGATYTAECPDWLSCEITDGYLPYIKNVKFQVTSLNEETHDIDALLQAEPSKGSDAAPYNLANPGEMVAPANATIANTANCYIVDGPGYYLLPLVYGNAIKNGADNPLAYAPGGDDSQTISKFKDYSGQDITNPYIKDTTTPESAFVLWQDENNLINYSIWDYSSSPTVKYLPEAYGGKGGIEFQITSTDIKQGNAVIALSTQSPTSDDIATYYRNVPVIWSWHIWVTNFSFLKNEEDGTVDEETIEVTGNDPSKKYDLLMFNLGWCSNHVDENSIITPGVNDAIKYYRGRKCLVKFYVRGTNKVETITLEQKSHLSISRGTSPYYQWGRKDPFIGATEIANEAGSGNKMRYFSVNWGGQANPPMLFDKSSASDARATTKEALNQGLLISHPQCWHNPKRAENIFELTGDEYAFRSINETYTNLWGDPSGIKTVYDPCPVGYQVPSYEAFTGFTTTGDNTNTDWEWYDAIYENIADYDPEAALGGIYYAGLYEFYTSPDKLQSIVIPESGYRDWDDMVCAYKVNINNPIGYLWTATYNTNPKGNHKDIFNLEFSRGDDAIPPNSYIRPQNRFYSCDGFPIRPVAEK